MSRTIQLPARNMSTSCYPTKVVFTCAPADNIYLHKSMFYINWFNPWRTDYFCGESPIFWWGNDFIIGSDKINKITADITNPMVPILLLFTNLGTLPTSSGIFCDWIRHEKSNQRRHNTQSGRKTRSMLTANLSLWTNCP